MKIVIETIPHKDQRYETVGDYWMDENDVMQIRVSDMGDSVAEKLVAVHELVEFILIGWKNISEWDITKFDEEYERNRKEGDLSEPGFDKKAPYRNEHAIATAVELMMCAHMDLAWQDYENKVNSL